MADDLGRHYCGGRMISAELSCAIGRRGGSEIAILLPGYTCTQCGTPQLHSDQVQVLEEVLAGGSYANLKHVTLAAGSSALALPV